MTAVIEGSVWVSRSVADMLAAGVVVADSLVLSGTADDPVAGWLVVERQAGQGRERRCVIVRPDSGSVFATGAVTEVMVAGDQSGDPVRDVMPVWVSALAAALWDADDEKQDRIAACQRLRAHEQRLEEIVDAAHEFADEHSLCEQFDYFMERQGLRPRSRDFTCEVDVTVRVRVSVCARSADAAAESVDDDMVNAALQRVSGWSDVVQDHEVVDTEAD